MRFRRYLMTSASNASITIQAGPEVGKVIDLTEDEVLIGRNETAGIFINHKEVSRRHARLTYKEGKYFLEDLGSSNGTVVNGQRISGETALADGAEIMLGTDIRLVFHQTSTETKVMEAMGQTAGMDSVPSSPGATMFDAGVDLSAILKSATVTPPKLLVTIAGQEEKSHTLSGDRVTLGRAEDNDIVVNSMIVSRYHAALELTSRGYEIVVSPGATNTLSCQGRPVTDRQLLSHGDVLRIDSDMPGMMVSMTYQSPVQAAAKVPFVFKFDEKEKLTIGRDPGNDIVLETPNVSRYHAQVTRVGRRYYITDLRSANGTFVNDKRVEGDVWLNPQDTIRIGPYKFVVGEDQFTRYDETEGMRVEAYHLNKWVRKDLNLLQDISLVYQPREFIVVVGQSGGGKSTLVDSIAGYRPATHGKVFVNDIDIYQNFDAIRSEIGYVPQKDIIHMELTVYQALDFAAQLRMPKDTTPDERHKRIMEVLEDLDLTHRKDVQISGLSGGQQKRVSIGVELLTRPGLFFLDEPTSGLDPGTETTFMHLMRRLADQGRTIIMVTHATKNVMLADKVVFMARGGYVAWFGPPDEALAYFDQFRSDYDRRVRPMEFDQIYTILDDPSKGNAKDWAERFQGNPAFQKYIVEPLQASQRKITEVQAQNTQPKKSTGRTRTSAWRQFLVLSKRNVTIILRDRSSLTLMLIAAPGVGALDLVLAPVMGKAPFSFQDGNAANGGITLFLLTLFALLVGGMSQMREFVKESDIYKRERLVNLQILPYVTSKVWVAMLLAFYQGLAYTVLHYLAFDMPGGFAEFLQVYVTLVLATMTGMMLGLVASALSPNSASAPLTMIMLIVPLIVLSGALAPVPPNISQVASTRWAFQSLLGIVGAGKDVAADACWQLDEDLRDAMNLDDKAYNQCLCMGTQVFDENSCSFPGVGQYYTAEINQSVPTEPPPLPPEPPEPDVPSAPEPPEDNFDQVQMAQYLNALSSYQNEVKDIQDGYRNQMDLYRSMADVYEGQMAKYQEDLARYNIARVSAVKGAEGIIGSVTEQYGWAWVDKDNPAIYFPWLFNTWFAQLKIVAVYFVIIVFLIKRKDVK
ncbi:MAG: ABC transporter ATP-binding protein [Anaerolineales bacterium]|nr:MAG: ABC transporter ATP-binding protein [Anaerolineales bacterium]